LQRTGQVESWFSWLPLRESVSQSGDDVFVGEAIPPGLGDALAPIEGSGQLAIDRAGGVSILAKIDSKQCAFAESVTATESPECSFERADHMPVSPNFRRFFLHE
jgi:hypothetical protein